MTSQSEHSQTDLLIRRSTLLAELRQFFYARGFIEIQPPCLSHQCIVDPYIDPITVDSSQLGVSCDLPPTYYLQTSPESAMKRLLAKEFPSMFSLGPVFRSGERGRWHNVEFTMLEWYDVNADMESGITLLGQLAAETLCRDHARESHYPGNSDVQVIRYRDLFRAHLGIDPIDDDLAVLQHHASQLDDALTQRIGDDRDALLDVLLSQRIQPALGTQSPTIVTHYPISQAALAKPAADDPQCAARFELFVNGIELANGYDELQDPDVLAERFRMTNEKRIRNGRTPLTSYDALLEAMRRGIPQCCGVALGVDRLMMCRCGVDSIAETMPFAIENA